MVLKENNKSGRQKKLRLPPKGKGGGLLSENIMHFARVLRRAGLPIGSGQVLNAVNAILKIDLSERHDFYWTLHAVFVSRIEQRATFDQAFHIFWRNPDILDRMMKLMLSDFSNSNNGKAEENDISKRVSDALASSQRDKLETAGKKEIESNALLTWSPNESLSTKDFEKMSTVEVQLAIAAVRRMRLPLDQLKTRRFKASNNGNKLDPRRSMRAALRSGADFIPLMKRERRTRRPPLVVICDISGSMERYSRMLLHFMHTVTNDRDRVYTFLFGTCLTNVTRFLRYKDVDNALEKVGAAATDWSGGTRIGYSIGEFNKLWSRRVLTQGAIIVLISDGLDRDAAEGLTYEMQRLHKSCRRLIWLNPLLRYEDFKPKSTGIRAMLPHVDDFRTIHNLESLRDLVDLLQGEKNNNSIKVT